MRACVVWLVGAGQGHRQSQLGQEEALEGSGRLWVVMVGGQQAGKLPVWQQLQRQQWRNTASLAALCSCCNPLRGMSTPLLLLPRPLLCGAALPWPLLTHAPPPSAPCQLAPACCSSDMMVHVLRRQYSLRGSAAWRLLQLLVSVIMMPRPSAPLNTHTYKTHSPRKHTWQQPRPGLVLLMVLACLGQEPRTQSAAGGWCRVEGRRWMWVRSITNTVLCAAVTWHCRAICYCNTHDAPSHISRTLAGSPGIRGRVWSYASLTARTAPLGPNWLSNVQDSGGSGAAAADAPVMPAAAAAAGAPVAPAAAVP